MYDFYRSFSYWQSTERTAGLSLSVISRQGVVCRADRVQPQWPACGWLAVTGRCAGTVCLCLWLGPTSPPNYSPQALSQANLWHTEQKRENADKRQRDACGDSGLKRIKGAKEKDWYKSCWELLPVLTERQLPVHPSSGELTFSCVSPCAGVHWFVSQTVQRADPRPGRSAGQKQNRPTSHSVW